MLSRGWRCSWSSADRRCFNYIWVINRIIAYYSAAHIRGLTVYLLLPWGWNKLDPRDDRSTLIPNWISNYTHYKKWDEITYPFTNSKSVFEVWELISNFISHYIGHVDNLWDENIHVVETGPSDLQGEIEMWTRSYIAVIISKAFSCPFFFLKYVLALPFPALWIICSPSPQSSIYDFW